MVSGIGDLWRFWMVWNWSWMIRRIPWTHIQSGIIQVLRRSPIRETIWKFPHVPLSNKNSFRRNYTQQYGNFRKCITSAEAAAASYSISLMASFTAAATTSTLDVVVLECTAGWPAGLVTTPAEVITTVVPGTASIMSSSRRSVTSSWTSTYDDWRKFYKYYCKNHRNVWR